MRLTYDLAMAAGRDAGNRSMRKAGRSAWNREDWGAAAECTNRLLKWAGILTGESNASAQQQIETTG